MEEPGERRLLCSLICSQCAEGHYAAVVHDDFRRRLRRGSEQSLGTSRFIKYCRAFRLQARDAAFDELEKFSLTRMQWRDTFELYFGLLFVLLTVYVAI